MCGLSGVQQATLLLVELSRSFPLFLFLCQGMLTDAVLLDLVSLFTTPGAYATPLPASYRKKHPHTTFSGDQTTRLLWGVKIHVEICRSRDLFQNKFLTTFDKKVTSYKSLNYSFEVLVFGFWGVKYCYFFYLRAIVTTYNTDWLFICKT